MLRVGEIARALGFSVNRTRYYLTLYHFTPAGRSGKDWLYADVVPVALRELIADWHEVSAELLSPSTIAGLCELPIQRVYNAISRYSIPVTFRHGSRKYYNREAAERIGFCAIDSEVRHANPGNSQPALQRYYAQRELRLTQFRSRLSEWMAAKKDASNGDT